MKYLIKVRTSTLVISFMLTVSDVMEFVTPLPLCFFLADSCAQRRIRLRRWR